MIEALIFDFGRVISAQKPPELFSAYEQERGLNPGTINRIMFESPEWQRALVGQMSMDEYWQSIGPSLNLTTSDEISAFQKRYYADEQRNERVVRMLVQLQPLVRLAILSNHPAGLSHWLRDWRLADLFESVVCSGEVGVAKPDQQAYRLVLHRLACSAHQVIFIDDTPGHVEAARKLGIQAIVFTDAAQLQADLVEACPELAKVLVAL